MKIIHTKFVSLMAIALFCCTGNAFAEESSSIERKYYNPWEKEYGYAPVAKIGNTLYLSGMVSSGDTMEAQIKGVYQSIAKILADYDLTTDNIVREVVYTKDMEALKKAAAVRKAFFSEDKYPASSWIQVDRMFNEEFLLEVEVFAVITD